MPHIRKEDQKREDCWKGIFRFHGLDRATGCGALSMGVMTLEPHTCMPCHSHLVEDDMYIIEGEGIARADGVDTVLRAGDFICVPAGAHHYLRNESDSNFTLVYVWPSRDVERYLHPDENHVDPKLTSAERP